MITKIRLLAEGLVLLSSNNRYQSFQSCSIKVIFLWNCLFHLCLSFLLETQFCLFRHFDSKLTKMGLGVQSFTVGLCVACTLSLKSGASALPWWPKRVVGQGNLSCTKKVCWLVFDDRPRTQRAPSTGRGNLSLRTVQRKVWGVILRWRHLDVSKRWPQKHCKRALCSVSFELWF